MPFEPAIGIANVGDATRALRAGGERASKLGKPHRKIAKVVEPEARADAKSATAQQAKAARAILGKGTAKAAVIAIRNLGKVGFGIGAFMGAAQYRQFLPWVGASWDITAGEGPYVIAPAIARLIPEIEDIYALTIVEAFEEAGFQVSK